MSRDQFALNKSQKSVYILLVSELFIALSSTLPNIFNDCKEDFGSRLSRRVREKQWSVSWAEVTYYLLVKTAFQPNTRPLAIILANCISLFLLLLLFLVFASLPWCLLFAFFLAFCSVVSDQPLSLMTRLSGSGALVPTRVTSTWFRGHPAHAVLVNASPPALRKQHLLLWGTLTMAISSYQRDAIKHRTGERCPVVCHYLIFPPDRYNACE